MKTCRYCAEPIPDEAVICPICRSDLRMPQRPSEIDEFSNNAAMRMMLPVGRSGWAIAAGYLGLLSLLPCFAPPALVMGCVAIWHLKRNPQLHGMGRAIFGLVMGVLGTGVLLFFIIVGITDRM